MVQVIECLPNKYKALNSNLSTEINKYINNKSKNRS
jgi:hypothetical protein